MAMKTKILTLCTLLALAVAPAAAQGIYEASLATENSIVRVWQERDVVIYNKEPSGQNGFLLYNIGNTTAQYIDMPDSITVKEFEIVDDEVWFCGECTSVIATTGRAGVVGTFNIPNTFAGTGDINFTAINTNLGYDGYQVFAENLERIDQFSISNNIVAVMTGGAYLYKDPLKKRSTVASAVRMGSSSWIVCVLLDKDSTAIFTDIAALDNVVTAVGTRTDNYDLIAKSFFKGLDPPNQPTTPSYGDNISCDKPIGKALITHLDNDEAAVTQLNIKGSTLLHMLDFSTYSAVPTAATRITANPGHIYDTEWDLLEIRYSPQTDNISVLEYGVRPNSPIFETLLWTFPRTTWWPSAPLFPMNTVTQTSMDVDIDNFPVTVGEVTGIGTLDIHSHIPGSSIIEEPLMEPDACVKYDEIPLSLDTPSVPMILVNDHGPFQRFPNEIHTPSISEIFFNPICQ